MAPTLSDAEAGEKLIVAVPPPRASALARAVDHLDGREPRHHDVDMRTTLTLDPLVARLIEEEMHRARKSFKQVVNEGLRRGLEPRARKTAAKAYRVRPHTARLLPGIDRGRLNALAEEIEDRAILAKAGRSPRSG